MKTLLSILVILLCLLPNVSFAARGCGATSGTGAGDIITTGSLASSTARTIWLRFYLNTAGATSQRLMTNTDSTLIDTIRVNSALGITYDAGWTTTDGAWTIALPSTGAWHTLAITYDGAATTNDPIFYYDGTTPAVTENQAPVGTLRGASQPRNLCSRHDGASTTDGMLAEFAIWSSVLTAGNIASLEAGIRPDSIGVAPVSYMKLCGTTSPEPNEVIGGVTGAVTGALAQPHAYLNCQTKKSGMHR